MDRHKNKNNFGDVGIILLCLLLILAFCAGILWCILSNLVAALF